MKKVHGFTVKMAFAALCASVMLLGVSQAHAQRSVFVGNFTLTQQTKWGGTVLQPGGYTIRIRSNTMPMIVAVTDSKGRWVADFHSAIDSGNTSPGNALFIKEKGEYPRVYSLALARLKRVLIYDTALAREAVLETRAPRTVRVTLAKR